MTVVMSNVDDKLVAGTSVNVPTAIETTEPIKEEIKVDEPKISDDKVEDSSPYGLSEEKVESKEPELENKDEYGSEVPKAKTYSEEEVNRIVRDRLKRTQEERKAEPVKQEEQGGDENWEQQLEGFVEKTIHKISEKEHENIRQAKEREALGRLEGNIHQSMGRYKDFQEVVSKAQITDTMVKATKGFKDPGAFLYAASKMQGKELQRISQLDDPLEQAVEIGKLEERMRKLKGASNSPRPMTEITGDISNRENIRPSVDDLIRKDQLKKFQRRN